MGRVSARHGATVAAGLASQFTVGGSGGAWSPGLLESVRVSPGRGSTRLGFVLQHARPVLADSTVLFPESSATGAGSGFRDELSLGTQVEVTFDVGSRIPKEDPVAALYPRITFGGSALFTDTQLTLPGFDGPVDYRGRAISPLLSFGVSLEARFLQWVSLVPRVDAALTAGEDEHEVGGGSRWNVETRLSPGVDFVVRY